MLNVVSGGSRRWKRPTPPPPKRQQLKSSYIMTNKDRYIATKAILNALMEGRQLSQLDCHEFQVEDMRTPISHLRRHYESTHDLKWVWITTPLKRRIKLYWLEKKSLHHGIIHIKRHNLRDLGGGHRSKQKRQ